MGYLERSLSHLFGEEMDEETTSGIKVKSGFFFYKIRK